MLAALFLSSLFFVDGIVCEIDDYESRILTVGKELYSETLDLKSGARLYQIVGFKSRTAYEVKISYPASIPARFSIQLKLGNSSSGFIGARKLLNTEKLMIRTPKFTGLQTIELYALVTVDPEGVVAIRNATDRKEVIFNIVCDELLLGIPQQAWWVVALAFLCFLLGFLIPNFLPSKFLSRKTRFRNFSKEKTKICD